MRNPAEPDRGFHDPERGSPDALGRKTREALWKKNVKNCVKKADVYAAGTLRAGLLHALFPAIIQRKLPASGVLCIDTGCGKGGRLTAMIVEGGCFRLAAVNGQ